MKIKWEKATPELIAFFEKRMAAVDCERRKMFGYPCCFFNNNMFTGVYKDVIIVRLPEKERVQALAEHKGTTIFEPIPGRVMKEYLALPKKIYRDKKIFDELVARSVKYVSGLPKKEKRRKNWGKNEIYDRAGRIFQKYHFCRSHRLPDGFAPIRPVAGGSAAD